MIYGPNSTHFKYLFVPGGHRGRDRMVVGLQNTYAISAYLN